jgi:hypothetical protein
LYTSGAQILGDEALQASSEDRDEGNRNRSWWPFPSIVLTEAGLAALRAMMMDRPSPIQQSSPMSARSLASIRALVTIQKWIEPSLSGAVLMAFPQADPSTPS